MRKKCSKLVYLIVVLTMCLSAPINARALQSTPLPSPTQAPSPQPVILSPNERYEYDKLRLERDLQKDLLDWAQNRFWIIALLVILVGFFGVRAFVREMVSSELKEAYRAANQAEAATKQTIEALAKAQTAADKYSVTVSELSATATQVDERFKSLESQISAEGSHAVANSEMQVSLLSTKLEELGGVVKSLSMESERNRSLFQEYDQRMLELSRIENAEREEFAANSKYSVLVVYGADDSAAKEFKNELLTELTSWGYRTTTNPWALRRPKAFNEIRIRHRAIDEPLGNSLYSIARDLSSRLNADLRLTRIPDLDSSFPQEAEILLV